MDLELQRAVEEEAESHAPVGGDVGGRGDPAIPVPEGPAQPQQALF